MPLGGKSSESFRSILEGLAYKNGTSRQSLSVAGFERYRHAIQDALEWAWNFERWSDLREYSQRQYADAWDVATAYSIDDIVYYASSESYWQALTAHTGTTPAEGTDWTAYEPDPKLVPWTKGTSTIGIPLFAWKKDPRKENESGNEHYRFLVDSLGVNITAHDAPHEVWMEYLPEVPSLSGDDWDDTTDWLTGTQCYHDTTGDYWKSLQDPNVNQEPAAGSAYWERVEVPAKFAQYIKTKAYADLLENDKQGRKADRELQKAEGILFRLQMINEGMAGQTTDIRRFA